MGKKASEELAPFVDAHPTTAVADLLSMIESTSVLDPDVMSAQLLRVATCDGVPDAIRALATQLHHDWDLERVSVSAAALLSLGSLLH